MEIQEFPPSSENDAGYEIYTYYLVDVTSGKTRILLKDQTGLKTKGVVESTVLWR
jgi:hypothetical protein